MKKASLYLFQGDVRRLWDAQGADVFIRDTGSRPQTLIGFLNSNGKWNSTLDSMFWENPNALVVPMLGQLSDWSWASEFHRPVGEYIQRERLRQGILGSVHFVSGDEIPDDNRVFRDVIWGVYDLPIVSREILRDSIETLIEMHGKEQHVVLPWGGIRQTMTGSFDMSESTRLARAIEWTEYQMKGIIGAARRSGLPSQLSILLPLKLDGSVNWLQLFQAYVEMMSLERWFDISPAQQL
jgi:hypothetical protein